MNCNPRALAAAAACYRCLPSNVLRTTMVYTLCRWANSGGCTFPDKAVNPLPYDTNDHVGSMGIGAGTGPTLSWDAAAGATGYDVWFRVGLGPWNQVSINQPGTTYTPATLAYSTAYSWRIDAVNACGTTTGDVWTFTTAERFRWEAAGDQLHWVDGGGAHFDTYAGYLLTADDRTVTSITEIGGAILRFFGIQSLPSLTNFTFTGGALVSIDVRDHAGIQVLNLDSNSINVGMDFHGCTALYQIILSSNVIPSIANLADCVGLVEITFSGNNIVGVIDVSTHGATLTIVNVGNNAGITNVILPAVANLLATFTAGFCGLTTASWDFSGYPALTEVGLSGNTNIDTVIVDGLANLITLTLSGLKNTFPGPSMVGVTTLQTYDISLNPAITAVDMSLQTALFSLDCNSCSLIDCRVGPSTALNIVYAYNNALPAAPLAPVEGVNAILIALAQAPFPLNNPGNVDVDTALTNDPPNGAGLVAKGTLIGAGWGVVTN